ncbi:DUF885 domain-containing protein [Pseudoalteromonas luteoviolacea]|uniref:DUF885 domain-containing protein n=1 Tax=Pseudoalteromonas luteoviolacea (strain 2ta16) TaxID=1353533 RepID=V4HMF7_PSEL2|nr:DUF885 domain-containing protein [Pseudoalteromonas luteoviolacea]ESP92000.1 hypothetical protein PL2TA16_04836 [Pseudoalteromonas luteoviolacea 2ta16]KZN29107.1 hypothetical protein N483_06660 [Pseudoalteromonas luteoviolacea NCIMB 1944]
MRKVNVLAAAVLFAITGCATESTSNQANSENLVKAQKTISRVEVDTVVDKYTKAFISHQPALATSLKLESEDYGRYENRLPDYSVAGMQALQIDMTHAAEQLKQLQSAQLSDKDRLHVQVNEVIARYYAGDSVFSAGYIDTWGGHLPYIVNQISGPLMDVPSILQNQHEISNISDAKAYVERLAAFAIMVDQVNEKVVSDAKRGIILPKPLFPNTLSYLNAYTEPKANEHVLVTSFATKLENLDGVSDRAKASLVESAASVMAMQVYPAFGRITAKMTELEKQASDKVGIWAQPNGEAFYQHAITYLADSDMTAQQIHEVGQAEVKRITNRMDEILKANGYTKGSVSERMKQLNEEPRFLFADSDQGRQELLDFLKGEIEVINEKAPQYFSTLPPQKVEVKRIPVEVEAGAPGGYYYGPSLDGSRPGVFAINLKDMKAVPSFGLKTLTYHEAVPGHHFQIALNMLQTDIGLMRQNASFNGYIEGWALYSELLAYEMGMYEGDPFGDLGRLQAEAYRAARLVVDTGLHYKKWTRQEAIEYFAEATGSAMSDVVPAIDRYIAWPGQALGYKLGMLKFEELRKDAQKALGNKFDMTSFHDEILLKGARPLALVEQDIARWVEKRKAM